MRFESHASRCHSFGGSIRDVQCDNYGGTLGFIKFAYLDGSKTLMCEINVSGQAESFGRYSWDVRLRAPGPCQVRKRNDNTFDVLPTQ